jgi:hypothetical protein
LLCAKRCLIIVMCITALPSAVMAQGAATGGTNDRGSPGMVYPIRPRQEAAPSTAVPNVARTQTHVPRLRQNYYYYRYRR